MSLSDHIKHFLLYVYHKYRNRSKVKFNYTSRLSSKCTFEGLNAIGNHSDFYGTLGLGSYIGSNCHINAYIGRFSSIGNNISQICETHPYKEPFVSTSPLFFSTKKQVGYTYAKEQTFDEYRFYDKKNEIAFKIGNDCWICNNVTIIGGVEIGDGAVVLTNAVVTKDVPPYAIVGGVPAKIIGYRYDQATIDFLLRTKWWNNDDDWFKDNWELLNDIDQLKTYYNEK